MSRPLFDLLLVAAGIALLGAGALLFNSAANAPYPRLRRYGANSCCSLVSSSRALPWRI